MGDYSPYVEVINRRWKSGQIDYETWRRHQNKLLQWMQRGHAC